MDNIIQSYIEAGIFTSAFFVLNEFLYLKRKRTVGFHFILAFIALLFQIKIVIINKYTSLPNPWLYFTSITTMFMIGPIQYGQTLRILDRFNLKQGIIHYSIIALTLPLEVLLILKFPEYIPEVGIQKLSVIIISLIALCYYFIYFCFNRKLLTEIVNSYNIKHYQDLINFNYIAAFLVCSGCICLIFSHKVLFEIEGILITTGSFAAIFYLIRYPDFFDTISEEIAQQKYERTSISDLNLEDLKNKLEILMREKKIYQDDQLYIDDIAGELLINKNQLSRILNESYNKNFYQFINYYRILEAKELLITDPKKNILDIAYEVGFKSKSAFYKNFFELTQLTPQEYRKNNAVSKKTRD